MLASSFACLLLGFRSAYPALRGARTLASAFLLGIPGILLIAMRGHISFFLSVVTGNLLVYVSLLLLYRGVLLIFNEKRYFTFALVFVCITGALHVYYALIDERIVPRIVIASVTMGVLSLLKAWTVFVHAERRIHRILFVISLLSAGCISLGRGVLTLIHGAPHDYMQQNPVQTYALLLGLLYIAVQGIFNLSLMYFDLASTIRDKAHRDPLTSILNRRAIEDKLQEELSRGDRTGWPVCALLIDVDFFKSVNDTHGHAAGDHALKLVAETLTASLRPFDHLGRFGGDEFLLILPELTLPDASARAESFRVALARTDAPTLSIGIAESDPGESAPALLARADAALYSAKHAGRDCIRLHHSAAIHPSDQSASMGT